MSKRTRTIEVSPPAEAPPERDDVGPAIQDITYRLTHDLSDTPEDLRDAAAFAPLAAIKLAQRFGRVLSVQPKRTILALAGLAVVLTGIAMSQRKRP